MAVDAQIKQVAPAISAILILNDILETTETWL